MNEDTMTPLEHDALAGPRSRGELAVKYFLMTCGGVAIGTFIVAVVLMVLNPF